MPGNFTFSLTPTFSSVKNSMANEKWKFYGHFINMAMNPPPSIRIIKIQWFTQPNSIRWNKICHFRAETPFSRSISHCRRQTPTRAAYTHKRKWIHWFVRIVVPSVLFPLGIFTHGLFIKSPGSSLTIRPYFLLFRLPLNTLPFCPLSIWGEGGEKKFNFVSGTNEDRWKISQTIRYHTSKGSATPPEFDCNCGGEMG